MMTEAQKVKLTRFHEIKEKITKSISKLITAQQSNANFYYEELSNLYYMKNQSEDYLTVVLEGRDDISIPLYCLNPLDMLNIMNFLDSHISRLAAK